MEFTFGGGAGPGECMSQGSVEKQNHLCVFVWVGRENESESESESEREREREIYFKELAHMIGWQAGDPG